MSLRQATINYQYPLYQTALAFMLLWDIKGSFLFGNKACGHLTENFSIADSPMVSDVEKSTLDLEHTAVLIDPYVNLVPMFSLPAPGGQEDESRPWEQGCLTLSLKKVVSKSEKKKLKKRIWALNTMSVWSS